MGAIVQVLFADGPDKALRLGNEEWGRELEWGVNWTRMRIGLLCNVTPDAANNLATRSFRIGISTAPTDHVGSNAATAWYGALLDNGITNIGGGTWYYNAGGTNPYYTPHGTDSLKVIAGVQSWQFTATNPTIPSNTGDPRRWPVFLEFSKAGGLLKLAMNTLSPAVAAANNRDFSVASLVNSMNDSRVTSSNVLPIDGVDAGPSLQLNYAFDPLDGDPNSIQIGWNNDAYPIYVYAVAVGLYES